MNHLTSFGGMGVVAPYMKEKDEIQAGQQRENMHVCWICR